MSNPMTQILGPTITKILTSTPLNFFGNKFNSEQQNFLSDTNHNAKPLPKENVRYSQMTMQEAEETFARRYLSEIQKF